MNASENLISLSNTSSFLSQSLNPNDAPDDCLNGSDIFGFGPLAPPNTENVVASVDERKEIKAVNNLKAQKGANNSGVLIDFNDEIEVPLPPAILTQAEVDDTFGIFSKVQSRSSGVSDANDSIYETAVSLGSNEASMLLGSFSSKRKSEDILKLGEREHTNDEGIGRVSSSSQDEKVLSSQNQESGGDNSCPNPDKNKSGALDKESGISEKMCVSSNMSGGSDSDYLDIRNLSSFSIPGDDVNVEDFLENVKREDMRETLISAAMVKQIKLELLGDVESSPESLSSARGDRLNNAMSSDVLELTDVGNRTKRLSVPVNRRQTRFSTYSEKGDAPAGDVEDEGPLFSVSNKKRNSVVSFKLNSTRLSVASDFSEDGASVTVNKEGAKGKGRLSSGFMNSSPIRASYPVSKFYMPTPKSKTPSRIACRERHASESLYSPSGTRNVLVTGEIQRSPVTKVPVRKSMSIETLHYENSPYRGANRTGSKFSYSTPSQSLVAANRQRLSVSIHEEDLVSQNNTKRNTFTVEEEERNRALFMQRREPRLSSASSVSNTSINLKSPNSTRSSVSSSARTYYTQKMKDTHLTFSLGVRPLPNIDANVQPMKATAIIPPTKEFTSEAQKTTKLASKTFVARPGANKGAAETTSTACKSKFIPPVAASSPRLQPSPSKPSHTGLSQTTPTRGKYTMNVRSSGYGSQNLNSTFEKKPPLTSPNKIPPASATAAIKQPVVPKSLKGGIPSVTKVESRSAGIKPRSALPAPKIFKAPVTSGLRRPTTNLAANKENTARATLPSKIGFGKPN